jgi:hypothetical protein
MTLSSDQIDAMAPDANSIAAGRKLAKPETWGDPGQSSAALWGECKGSSVYQVQVDLSEMAYKFLSQPQASLQTCPGPALHGCFRS